MSEPSGRELDAWLCQRLFADEYEYIGLYSWKWKKEATQHAVRRKSDSRAMLMPHYSGADWQTLAEAMRQKGWQMSIEMMPDKVAKRDYEGMPYYCQMSTTINDDGDELIAAADAPRHARRRCRPRRLPSAAGRRGEQECLTSLS